VHYRKFYKGQKDETDVYYVKHEKLKIT